MGHAILRGDGRSGRFTSSLERLEARQLLSASSRAGGAGGAGHAGGAGDVVVQWNNVLLDALRHETVNTGPTWASRNAAIVQLSVADAVANVTHDYEPLVAHLRAPRHASVEAAVAGAAHDALVALFPAQAATFDAALVRSLGSIHDGRRHEHEGLNVGSESAAIVLAARAHDHSDVMMTFPVDHLPGHWEPDPLNPAQSALGVDWGGVTPFTMTSGAQFRPAPPPVMTSNEYLAAFNEVKSLGALHSTTRTADETQIGHFWAYDVQQMGSPVAMYNEILQQVGRQQHNTMIDNARLFGLANVAMADAGIAAWDCKYVENFWRPITAIRRAGEDGNPSTTADPTWTPLGAPGDGYAPDFTPPFPAYISGHATFGAATFGILRAFYGTDNLHFTLTSDELPGVTRSFNHFTDAADENGRSRIYLGIHWQFDNTEGQACGFAIAGQVYQTAFAAEHRRLSLPMAPHGVAWDVADTRHDRFADSADDLLF